MGKVFSDKMITGKSFVCKHRGNETKQDISTVVNGQVAGVTTVGL